MKIGSIDLGEKPVFLAPMEDVTDPSFRYICKGFGADMMYTEFISSDGLIRDAAKTIAKMQVYDYERPIGIQLYGHRSSAKKYIAKRSTSTFAQARTSSRFIPSLMRSPTSRVMV